MQLLPAGPVRGSAGAGVSGPALPPSCRSGASACQSLRQLERWMFLLPCAVWALQQEPAQRALLFVLTDCPTAERDVAVPRVPNCGCPAKRVGKQQAQPGCPFSCSGSLAKLLA